MHDLCFDLKNVKMIPNACIILDNARIHRCSELERITSEFGFTFAFLSPYSYMLNPIENAFSKIKNCVRSQLRTGTNGLLADLILTETQNVSIRDCEGFFRHISRNIVDCAAEIPYSHR